MNEYYRINVAGLERDLRLFPVNENLKIAAFIVLGDVELTVHCAKALLDIAPEYDILVTAEAKSIPLISEMARQSGDKDYIVLRKAPKVYMENLLEVNVNSITTSNSQRLCIGDSEVSKMRGRKCLIIDDVISTGDSLSAMEKLVNAAGGIVCGKISVLAEGDAANRDDIKFLATLHMFDEDGNPLD